MPQIAPKVAQLTVFQRTPAWVIPKPDRPFSDFDKSLFKIPLWRRLFRKYLFYLHELRVLAFLGNERALKLGGGLAVKHLEKQVADPGLRAKLAPTYKIGCKRIMLSNDYYPALQRPNVELVTEGIREVRAHSIVDAAGIEREADAIIFGTGFEVTTAYRHLKITGTAAVEEAKQRSVIDARQRNMQAKGVDREHGEHELDSPAQFRDRPRSRKRFHEGRSRRRLACRC